MRLIVIAVAAFVASTPALAEGWEEYNYPEYAFAVSFPAAPAVQTMTYRAPGGRAVSAQVYTATADNTVFTMTVADLSGAEDSETAVIDNAIKQLTEGGDIKVDIPHRVRRVY